MMPHLPVDRAWVSRYKWFSKPLQNQPESNHALRHYAFDKLMTSIQNVQLLDDGKS